MNLAMPPDIGSMVESSEKVKAMNVTMNPPMIQLTIAAGPAILAAITAPNNQPEPIMQLSDVPSMLMLDIERCSFIGFSIN